MSAYSPGEALRVPYPFVRETVALFDGEGPHDALTWRPGIRFEDDGFDGATACADALGEQILTVVSTHKPGRFPTRVFYTRQWRDPDGNVFGKTRLRMTTETAFRALVRGYRHEFELPEKKEVAA